MFPWEHLAFAYVLYSLFANVALRRAPTSRETVAVVIGSQLPDLVDKPLAWTFGITETGYSIGHSIFVAPIVCLAVYAVAARHGDRLLAGAFALAYGSHLVTDVYDPLRESSRFEPRVVLWPLESPPAGDHGGFLDHFALYFVRYVNELLAGGVTPSVALQLGLGVAVVALWLVDGAPIAADGYRWLRTRLQA
ncbi:metal-dependent hydrolase [Natronorubrum texcoconense]|uniref:LexA-binding, inner membrane-associated putative hydrolase n=1 Tax=Natronorubrum texcoconense TaxID=1095776 RepID=A0A1G8XCQ3_9EURY|nr:metal-dependent hydrolase [Natronorubrum texcoconense]SDJ88388.1 LexA-binding, inner membrane-associated putative hydrolase [Natronorubrum texcoconense]